jgi:hypothetical protein
MRARQRLPLHSALLAIHLFLGQLILSTRRALQIRALLLVPIRLTLQ